MMTIRLTFLLLLLACSSSLMSAELHSASTTLAVEDEKIIITQGDEPLIELTFIQFNYVKAERWEVVSAGDDQLMLRGHFPARVDFHRLVQDSEPRFADLLISKVNGGFRFHSNPPWARQTTLTFNYLGDHFFGLSELLQPDNRLSPDLAPGSVFVDVNAEPASLQENYASAFSAFYMSSFGYGSFFDTFARGRYDFAINGSNRIHHDTGELDWYVFFGSDGAQIHQFYYQLIGQPKPVPAWGLGPIGWRDQNNGGSAEIIADIEKMNALHIPFTAWFVDRPYSDGAHKWSRMNFNRDFSNPEQWIGTIRNEYGLEFMTWASPATFGDTRFEKHLAGAHSYLDLSHTPSVQAYQDELRNQQYVYGVKGHKIDRADENFPLYEVWFDESVIPAERRNLYTFLMAKTHDEVLREKWGDDQFTFQRAAIHRTQPYMSAVWGGDSRSSWEGLQSNLANAARSAFMGFPVWGTDVGGYLGAGYIPEDLYIRWLQAASMSGLFEIKLDGAGGEGRDRMPWQYDENFQQKFREICEDRMQMLPYLYSLSRTSGHTGTLMQPLAYRHLGDKRTYDIWDQYYLGGSILVAPVFSAVERRSIYLPEGNWRDFDRPNIRYEGGKTITMDVPLEKLPRFVRENSIYVTGNVYSGNERTWNKSPRQLTIHAFPGGKNSRTEFTYIDMLDGDLAKIIRLEEANGVLRITSPAFTHESLFEVALDQQPIEVKLNGRDVETRYDGRSGILFLAVAPNVEVEVSVQSRKQ